VSTPALRRPLASFLLSLAHGTLYHLTCPIRFLSFPFSSTAAKRKEKMVSSWQLLGSSSTSTYIHPHVSISLWHSFLPFRVHVRTHPSTPNETNYVQTLPVFAGLNQSSQTFWGPHFAPLGHFGNRLLRTYHWLPNIGNPGDLSVWDVWSAAHGRLLTLPCPRKRANSLPPRQFRSSRKVSVFSVATCTYLPAEFQDATVKRNATVHPVTDD